MPAGAGAAFAPRFELNDEPMSLGRTDRCSSRSCPLQLVSRSKTTPKQRLRVAGASEGPISSVGGLSEAGATVHLIQGTPRLDAQVSEVVIVFDHDIRPSHLFRKGHLRSQARFGRGAI